ncbi:MAG: cysteine desulfurase family protein [Anaerovorax sp.]|nr:cysteine desulfurase family protein [Anaerovorax sp.]
MKGIEMFVYLDNSATTKPYDKVTETMADCMKNCFGNPSSLHRLGIAAEKELKTARKAVANVLHVKEEEIYFTSGGTESDNTAIFGAAQARKRKGKKIITSQIEHPAVLEACRYLEQKEGFHVVYIGVDQKGRLNLEQLADEMNEETILVTIMHVNNELGTIQPISEIGSLKRENTLFHTDAVQSFGKEKINFAGNSVDFLSLSGHKIHGPKGIGALYVNRGIHIPPFIYGGGQEKGFRSGTENVPAIVGLGSASQISIEDFERKRTHVIQIRTHLLEGLKEAIPNIRINSPESDDECGPYILNVSFLGCRAEVLLHSLEQKEIYVSTGSACSSKKKGSHILRAVGLSDEAMEGAIRFSFSEDNTIEQMDYVLEEVKKAVETMRKLRGAIGRNRR